MSDPISSLPVVPQSGSAVDYPRMSRLRESQTADQSDARKVKLKKAAQDFESLFIHYMLKRMRATVPKNDESQFGLETMREITDEQLAIHLARHGGIGLGDMLVEALEREESLAEDNPRGPAGRLQVPERMIDLRTETRSHLLKRAERAFTPLPASPTPGGEKTDH